MSRSVDKLGLYIVSADLKIPSNLLGAALKLLKSQSQARRIGAQRGPTRESDSSAIKRLNTVHQSWAINFTH
jgi:hypothetical protein